jgi:DNA helicase-2/ATP-dependent DNA helicase PcrA
VVDYKTGKPKTRNDIMGNTKTSTGDYYRQLVFYKLLLRHHDDGKYRMKTGEIVFVAPDTKGGFRREKFEISEEEVDELETTIRRVAEEIINLSFWGEVCDTSKCDYCDLVEHIKKNA